MDRYGYIRILDNHDKPKIIYIVNNTRYTLFSISGDEKQYISVSEDRDNFWLTTLGYKKILDNGLEKYLKDLIKHVCIEIWNTQQVIEYKLPQQPYFDALITKIKNDWIDNN